MANKKLWSPKNKINNLYNFQNNFLNKKHLTYDSLHKWSIKNKDDFWSSVWDFAEIIGDKKKPYIKNENDFLKSVFFKNSKLNFTENLLIKNNENDAIVFFSEQGFKRRISWYDLKIKVNQVAAYLKKIKIKKGDRVAGILPNIPETIITFLAVAKIGAIWSSCSPDFGPQAIIERFAQIKPKILIISDKYYYNNKKIETLKKIEKVLQNISSVKKVILIPYDDRKKTKYNIKYSFITWDKILNKKNKKNNDIYKRFSFNTPLYILFSSGTTGPPKCIVHGAGGSLIQHKKEHLLHCDINEGDKVFYFTTCGWMMWNWLVSSLSSKATIYLYDGSPFYPNKNILFDIIDNEKITFFGTSAKYLDFLKNQKAKIKYSHSLKSLKTIASTGSPLVSETFEYVYQNIKKDVHLTSISGGTDIVSCFVLGNPNKKVFSGEIQVKGLGMDVDILDIKGNSLKKDKGELVCKSTFPSKPIYFWKDKNNKKFINSYFTKYKNIWHHGDFAKFTINKGFIIYGRSDATLNSGGIRIGTAEIYRVVENLKKVQECIAVEHTIKDDTEIILFVKLNNKNKIDKILKKEIMNNIKLNLSPKHVPKQIFAVKDIPKTKSGKIVELTIKKLINNKKITNISSLENPECLTEYKKIAKDLIFK